MQEWRITAAQSNECDHVRITSEYFNTEKGYDFVEINRKTLSGKNISIDEVVGTTFYVKFSSDGAVTKDGFTMVWTCISDEQLCQTQHYRGQVNQTITGTPCQWWSNFSHIEQFDDVLDHNFCRNPDSSDAPWCYTSVDPIVKEPCACPDVSITTTSAKPTSTTFVKTTTATSTKELPTTPALLDFIDTLDFQESPTMEKLDEAVSMLTSVVETLAKPMSMKNIKQRSPADNAKDLAQRSEQTEPLLKALADLSFGVTTFSNKDDMMDRLTASKMSQGRQEQRAEFEKINKQLVNAIENLKMLAKFSPPNQVIGSPELLLLHSPPVNRSRRAVTEPIRIGGSRILLTENVGVTINVLDNNILRNSDMSDEPMVGLDATGNSGNVKIYSNNKHNPESMRKTLTPGSMELIKISPSNTADFFIWIHSDNPVDTVTAYIGYNIIPRPDLYIFEIKIQLPANNYDSQFSQANCKESIEDCYDPAGFDGDPYGIFLSRDEIRLCNSKSPTGRCILFIALQPNAITTSVQDVNVTTMNANCMIKVENSSSDNRWSSDNCKVAQFETNKTVTTCDCTELPGKFDVCKDIFVPPRSLNFDQIFIDGCEECAIAVIYFGVAILGIWLCTLIVSSVRSAK